MTGVQTCALPISDTYYNQENYQNQEPPQDTQNQNFYQPEEQDFQYSNLDTDTILEISEQVFYEKIRKIRTEVEKIEQFRTLTSVKLENLSERLKKIENIIEKLQISILGKIGEYGENINGIKKEMSMIEDSFGKLINPLLDKKNKSKKRREIKTKKKRA